MDGICTYDVFEIENGHRYNCMVLLDPQTEKRVCAQSVVIPRKAVFRSIDQASVSAPGLPNTPAVAGLSFSGLTHGSDGGRLVVAIALWDTRVSKDADFQTCHAGGQQLRFTARVFVDHTE